jgi:beta-lactamase class A
MAHLEEADWQALAEELNAHAEQLRGTAGFWVEELWGARSAGRLADRPFPTASTIKTALMVAVLREVEAGRMAWTETLPVPPPDRRELSPWSWFFPEGQPIDVDGWVNLMIGYSDNTATIVLRDRVGTETINRMLEELGFRHTRLLSGARGDSAELAELRARFGLGVTTPREMARLLKGIALGHWAGPAASERMVRILSHQYWDNLIASAVPPGRPLREQVRLRGLVPVRHRDRVRSNSLRRGLLHIGPVRPELGSEQRGCALDSRGLGHRLEEARARGPL